MVFIVWIIFICLEQKAGLQHIKNYVKIKIFVILWCLFKTSSDKSSFIIYADLKSFIKKLDGCKNNPEKSATTKSAEHLEILKRAGNGEN